MWRYHLFAGAHLLYFVCRIIVMQDLVGKQWEHTHIYIYIRRFMIKTRLDERTLNLNAR